MSKGKTCGECKHYDMHGGCNKIPNTLWIHSTNIACIKFEAKNPTNGDVIRHGGDRDFAEYFVYETGAVFASTLIVDKTFDTYEEAVKATEDYLNAPGRCSRHQCRYERKRGRG